MITILSTGISILAFRFRRRASLELELIGLRHQVSVLRREHPGRLRLFSIDRLLWVWLYRIWPQVLDAMVLVKPATVVELHRKGFRRYWRWRSRRPGRPRMSTEIRNLIRRMSLANPVWGAPRIHGELLKLGIEVSQATVGRYLPWLTGSPEAVAYLRPQVIMAGAATQRPRPSALRSPAAVVVAATAFALENGAPAFVNFPVRTCRLVNGDMIPLGFLGCFIFALLFELQKVQKLQKGGFRQFLQFL